MSNIRVTYSGLISFGLVFTSIFTGIIFTLIVTRRLTPDEFGLWSLVGSLITFVMILDPITSYWTARQVARNEQVTGTAIGGSGIFTIIAIGIYFILIFVVANVSDVNYDILLFSVLMIPFFYMNKIIRSIISGYKPQGNGYGLIIFEVTKIPAGLILVYFLDMGIIGAIATTIIAQCSQLIFFLYYIKEKLKEKFCFSYFKTWLKNSWLPLFSGNTDRISQLDVVIYLGFMGSVTGIAYVGIAKTIGNLVSMTTYLSAGLYPKLIATKKLEYIELMFKRTLLFSIPMLGLTIIFAKPGLWILNPVYIEGILVIYVWSLIQFSTVFLNLFSSSLTGLETVDEKKNSNFKEYLKSKLFFVPAIDYIGRGLYLIGLIIVIPLAINSNISDLNTIFLWGLVGLVITLVIVVFYWRKLSKEIVFKFPLKSSIKYVVATLASSIPSALLLENYLTYDESIFIFGPNLIPYFLLYVSIYFVIMISWDKETRQFLHLIINEIKREKKI